MRYLSLLILLACDDKSTTEDTGPVDEVTDIDGDSYTTNDGDCDDEDAAINPGAEELCDGVDNDCDGTIDGADSTDASTFYADTDADGFGDVSVAVVDCEAPSGHVADASDCDDGEASSNPDAAEVCDGADNNCDGTVDEGVTTTFFEDADADGFGNPDSTIEDCEAPGDGWVLDDGDCDDGEAVINPDAAEVCDGIDNDCDSGTVEGGMVSFTATGSSTVIDVTADFAGGVDGAPLEVALSDSGTVLMCDGTWYVSLDITADELSISSLGGADATILSGGDTARVVTVSDTTALELSGLTMTAGFTPDDGGYGGAVYAYNTALTVTDSVISDSWGNGGGGLYSGVGDVSISGTTISDNFSYGLAGGLRLEDCTATISDTTIEGNEATTTGGGSSLSSAIVTMSGVTLTGNTSEKFGGGMQLWNSDVTASDLTVTDNELSSSSYGGGGLALRSDTSPSTVTVTDLILSGNTSAGDGGGLYISDDGAVQISGGSITDNIADGNGGGFYMDSGTLDLAKVDFSGNSPDSGYTSGSGSESLGKGETLSCDNSGCL